MCYWSNVSSEWLYTSQLGQSPSQQARKLGIHCSIRKPDSRYSFVLFFFLFFFYCCQDLLLLLCFKNLLLWSCFLSLTFLTPQEWIALIFSYNVIPESLSHMKVLRKKGNDHQLKKLLIVEWILLVSTWANFYRTVWRICMLMLGREGLGRTSPLSYFITFEVVFNFIVFLVFPFLSWNIKCFIIYSTKCRVSDWSMMNA